MEATMDQTVEILKYESDSPTKLQIDETSNIKRIRMTECVLKRIPSEILQHQGVEVMEFRECVFTQHNALDSLKQFKRLLKLDLSECELVHFPSVLSKLRSLEELCLKGNECIKVIPDSIWNLQSLKKLDLSRSWYGAGIVAGNGLTEFPSVVSRIPNLEDLNLSRNSFKNSLPLSVVNLTHLKKMNLSWCNLPDFPEILTLLSELQELNLSENGNIKTLPANLMPKLKKLEKLDVSFCCLSECPEVLSQLTALTTLNLSGNKDIKTLPGSFTALTNLVKLNVSRCGIICFPEFIYEMSPLLIVSMRDVNITIMNEKMVRYWYENPIIWDGSDFAKTEGLNVQNLCKPPFEIFEKGATACNDYYYSLKVTSEQKCALLNVQVLGITGSGKTSLVNTLRKGRPSLACEDECCTVVVNSLKIIEDDILLQICDFGGHDLYELTYPIFLKSARQTTLLAIKLADYNESTHDQLVTKWLSNICAHTTTTGNIAIIGTQIDLCTKKEIEQKMTLLKENVAKGVEAELEYKKLLTNDPKALKKLEKDFHNFEYFLTSSANMTGVEDLKEFLNKEALRNKMVLPNHWSKMYTELGEFKDDADSHSLSLSSASDIFWRSLPMSRRFFAGHNDLHRCLQFFHDTGMILWLKENEFLRDSVFPNVLFIIKVLQCLFHHNLEDHLKYEHTKHRTIIQGRTEFETSLKEFLNTGLLPLNLLRCIWVDLNFDEPVLFRMIHFLMSLDLCYVEHALVENKNSDLKLRLPWFVDREDSEGTIRREWPPIIPRGMIQYTLVYGFFQKIPSTIYERFCVRLQVHLVRGTHFRRDYQNMVFALQDGVRVLIQRENSDKEPTISINVRSPIKKLMKLRTLLLAMYSDIEKLCAELPGIVMNPYIKCPHCMLLGKVNPTRRRIHQIVQKISDSTETIPCDPSIPDSSDIPAAMIFLDLLAPGKLEKHLKSVEESFRKYMDSTRPTVPDGLLLRISKYINYSMKLKDVGCALGIEISEMDVILAKHPNNIEEAAQDVLFQWKQQRKDEHREKQEMKAELKAALCSADVGLNIVADSLLT